MGAQHRAVADAGGRRQGESAQSRRQRRLRFRRGRAGFRHAEIHQGRLREGARRRENEIRADAGHSSAAQGDCGGLRFARVPQPDGGEHRAQPRRENVLLSQHRRDDQPGRRGDHSRAVLGELSGNGQARGRRSQVHFRGRYLRLQSHARAASRGDHAEDAPVHPDFAVQPHGNGLHARGNGGARRRRRRARYLRSFRRNLRAPHLRRRRREPSGDVFGPRGGARHHGVGFRENLRDDRLASRHDRGAVPDREGGFQPAEPNVVELHELRAVRRARGFRAAGESRGIRRGNARDVRPPPQDVPRRAQRDSRHFLLPFAGRVLSVPEHQVFRAELLGFRGEAA